MPLYSKSKKVLLPFMACKDEECRSSEWAKPWSARREKGEADIPDIREVSAYDPGLFFNYLGMNPKKFH